MTIWEKLKNIDPSKALNPQRVPAGTNRRFQELKFDYLKPEEEDIVPGGQNISEDPLVNSNVTEPDDTPQYFIEPVQKQAGFGSKTMVIAGAALGALAMIWQAVKKKKSN